MDQQSASPTGPSPPRRNIQVLAARTFVAGMRIGVVSVMRQPFVLNLGVWMSLLGFLESLGGFRGLTTTPARWT